MTSSKISAVLHEAEDHFGENLLKAENPDIVKEQVDQRIMDSMPGQDKAKKIRGK
jgi:hypothetical protein